MQEYNDIILNDSIDQNNQRFTFNNSSLFFCFSQQTIGLNILGNKTITNFDLTQYLEPSDTI